MYEETMYMKKYVRVVDDDIKGKGDTNPRYGGGR